MKKIFIVGVTGVPATGKTSFSKVLKKELDSTGKKTALIELNDIVKKRHAYSSVDRLGTMVVDTGKLSLATNSELKKQIAAGKDVIIIVGHLVPELSTRCDIAVVTRLNLKELVKRMERRGYAREKLHDNVLSEAYDYCGTRMAKKCRETYEAETGAEKRSVLKYIKSMVVHGRAKKPETKRRMRMEELLDLIKNNRTLGL